MREKYFVVFFLGNVLLNCLEQVTKSTKNLNKEIRDTVKTGYFSTWSRVSSGSIVSDYGLDDRAIGVRSPAGAKDFSSSICVQTGSEAHPASCPMGTGGPFPGGKSAAGA
jgi:hypothetical protein